MQSSQEKKTEAGYTEVTGVLGPWTVTVVD